MPYLRILITTHPLPWPHEPHAEPSHLFADTNETEVHTALEELRELFPLQQSEGHFYRMFPYYILFEQPEHMALTLEQELWLEQHGYDSLSCACFYPDQTRGCRTCGAPFDNAPSGYLCQDRYTSYSYQTTNIKIPYSTEELRYQQSRSYSERLPTRQTILTLADLIEHANDQATIEQLLATDQHPSTIATFLSSNACPQCQRLLAQCTCPQTQSLRDEDILFTHQEYAYLQALTDSWGLTLEMLMRPHDIPEVRMAAMTRNAAIGYGFGCDFTSWLSFFAQPNPYTGKRLNPDLPPAILAFRLPREDGDSIKEYHLSQQATSLAQNLPLLTEHAIDILLGLSTMPTEQSHLAWCKEQLQYINLATYQEAKPCTGQEIAELEQQVGASLPEAYKEFLAWMGHGAGSFMHYLDIFYPSLANHQARTLLAQDVSSATLPDDAVVFYMRSDRFAFFRTSEGADPPIYAHKRDWRITPFKLAFYRFSDFLAVQLAIYARYITGNIIPTHTQNKDEAQKLSAVMEAKIKAIIKQTTYYSK